MPSRAGSTSRGRALALAAVLCACGCAAGARSSEAQSSAPPSQSPRVVAATQLRPALAAPSALAAAPSKAVSVVAMTAAPVPVPVPVVPAIYAASASPTVAHAGDVVAWDVRTSAEVATVTAGVKGFTVALERRSAGRFGVSFRIPSDVPGLFHGEYHVVVTATDPDGSKARTSLTMRFE